MFDLIFQQYGFVSYTPERTSLPQPDENGKTVVENALIKARHYYSPDNPWVFGDDTGLEIDALGGAPGVQLRRWGGYFPDNVPDDIWLEHLLTTMKDIPPGKRIAHLVDGWALITPEGKNYTYETRATFEIATKPVRPIHPGAPIFAVIQGLPDNPTLILEELKTRWKEWGISSVLRKGKPHGRTQNTNTFPA